MPKTFDIIPFPFEHYSDREGASINSIVIHCVGTSLEQLFNIFEEKQVSAHFVVPQITAAELQQVMPAEFGHCVVQFPDRVPVIQFVDPAKKAWHAGMSNFADFNQHPACSENLNACSIGIEFHTHGYANTDGSDWYKFTPFTVQQCTIGIALVEHLATSYAIPRQNILAHSTIAVGRKTDPGPLFFWRELFQQNLGYLPESKKIAGTFGADLTNSDAVTFIQSKLQAIGFNNCVKSGELDDNTKTHIDAYIMQFAPHLWQHRHTPVTKELLDSLNGFDMEIRAVAKVAMNV